jgi:peptidoglycan hydrolase-like protein with peptidoglycan-binding domain
LLANIAQPGVEIQQAMTKVRAQVNEETSKGQLPWGHTNLIGSVYLNPAAANAAAEKSTSAAVATSTQGPDVEVEFWRSVKDSSKPEELKAYLTSYPNGQFKALALARIASLEHGPSTATRTVIAGVDPATFTEEASQLTEDQIGLNKTQRGDIQRRLTGLGFDTNPTGAFDDDTRAIVKRWQAARGYPVSGYFNRLQHKALLIEIQPKTATAPPGAAQQRRPSGGTAAAAPPPAASAPAGNPAGAAFVGGMMGGIVGSALRR